MVDNCRNKLGAAGGSAAHQHPLSLHFQGAQFCKGSFQLRGEAPVQREGDAVFRSQAVDQRLGRIHGYDLAVIEDGYPVA